MNKRAFKGMSAILCVVVLLAMSAFAMANGVPGLHELSGKDFGAAVSGLAKVDPAALADHVSKAPEMEVADAEMAEAEEEDEEEEMGGGMPAAHDLTGQKFGEAVSALAKSAPGAVAEHVAAMKGDVESEDEDEEEEEAEEMGGGMPAAHGLTGAEFGAEVSNLAQSAPGAVAEHVAAVKGDVESEEEEEEEEEEEASEMGGGMPAAHGISGEEFGAAVSEMAESAPGAVAEHVKGK
jgi:hypothetical protein